MRVFIIILASIILICSCKTGEVDLPLNRYTDTFPDSTQVSIALVNNGNINYVGYIKLNGSLRPITNNDAVFEIGSITKIFTATLIVQLITDGRVGLDDRIEGLLPFSLSPTNFNYDKITINNLLSHTSGLPEIPENFNEFFNDTSNWKVYNSIILEEYLKNELVLVSEPGEEYRYSNLGYAILGYLIEKQENSEYERILQQYICERYNLQSTTTQYQNIRKKLVQAGNSAGHLSATRELGVFKSTGGIMSSVADLATFVAANFEKDSLLEYQRRELYHLGNSGMAFGWQINDIGFYCKWYNHNGRMDGYCSSVYMDVPSKTAVILLSNLPGQHPGNDSMDKLAFELMKNEYLNNDKAQCKNAFVEGAIKEGWGTHILEELVNPDTSINSIVGIWTRKNNNQIITRTFTEDYKVQTDFYKDKEIDVWGYYELSGNQVVLKDIGGEVCSSRGIYEYQLSGDTLRFKLISDDCGGRKADLLNEWKRMK